MSGPDRGKRDDDDADNDADKNVQAAPTPLPPPPTLERSLSNDLESLVHVTAALDELLARHAVSADASRACSLALEEIVTNIIKYAYADPGPHEIGFAARLTADHVVLRFTDDGREFNPLTAPAPDLDRPLHERPIGGLGIHLVRKLAQHMEYERTGGRNTLTAFFALHPKE